MNSFILKTSLIGVYLLFFVNSSIKAQSDFTISFNTENEILKWGAENYNSVGDSTTFIVGDNKYFVFSGDNHSGLQMRTIYLFEKSGSNRESVWFLICYRFSFAKAVLVELDRDKDEVIFKSEKNKVIMSIPFESLDFAASQY